MKNKRSSKSAEALTKWHQWYLTTNPEIKKRIKEQIRQQWKCIWLVTRICQQVPVLRDWWQQNSRVYVLSSKNRLHVYKIIGSFTIFVTRNLVCSHLYIKVAEVTKCVSQLNFNKTNHFSNLHFVLNITGKDRPDFCCLPWNL